MVADRHGRAYRADNDARRRPPLGFRVEGVARFRRVIADAASALPAPLATPLEGARVVIEDVPPDPVVTVDGDLVLATFADGVLTVYRRPVELRADTRTGLEETLIVAIGQAVARALGYGDDPEQWLD
jgi:hypothetical protein